MRIAISGCLVLIMAAVTSGCSPFKPLKIESREHPDFYDDLFPYYVEVCALSRIRPVNGNKGSRAGHAVLHLKGVCQDTDAGFPAIRLCPDGGEGLRNTEAGVGISVNKMFRNVNWVAVPGQDLFFHGELASGERLTEEKRQQVIRRALDLGIFKGVEIHEAYLKSKLPEQSLEEFIAGRSIGTDYALKFGRSNLCLKIPVTRAMAEDMVDYLNMLNRHYFLGGEEYKWGVLFDNCTHTIYNTLASASMMRPRMVRAGRLRQFFNLAVPANAVASLADLASPDPLDDIRRVRRNKKQRQALLKYNWLPMRHGVVLSIIPVHGDNELYEVTAPDFETLVLRSRTLKSRTKLLKQAFQDERFTDLAANLAWFEKQYEAISRYCATHPGTGRAKDAFYETYCAYIRDQLQDVRGQAVRLKKVAEEK